MRSAGKPAEHATASSPAEQTSRDRTLVADPVGHGTAEERLAGVGDLRAGKRPSVRATPVADIGLVQDVRGRAVARRELGERDTANGDLATGPKTRGPRPYLRGQTGRLRHVSRCRHSPAPFLWIRTRSCATPGAAARPLTDSSRGRARSMRGPFA